jgi:hypothetical protein
MFTTGAGPAGIAPPARLLLVIQGLRARGFTGAGQNDTKKQVKAFSVLGKTVYPSANATIQREPA